MSAAALPPTAPTTLVILLGTSAWPNSPGFQASEAFVHAAQGFKDFALDPQGFGLPAANLFDLFDTQTSASDQLEMLGSFLEQRAQTLKVANQAVRDVLVYFVGHGGFAGPSADFYLLHRRANASSLRATGMAIDALAEVLREKARQARRYLVLDCCFAAAAFRAFQGGPDQIAVTKTMDAFQVQARSNGFPGKGTVLLCSSDQKSPSLLLPDESCTMFSHALLDVLRKGDLHRPRQLSLRDIKELAEDRLVGLPEKNAPRPSLHSPDQSEGDVADVPFFPNPLAEEAEQTRLAEEERHHLAQEERIRIIEEQPSPPAASPTPDPIFPEPAAVPSSPPPPILRWRKRQRSPISAAALHRIISLCIILILIIVGSLGTFLLYVQSAAVAHIVVSPQAHSVSGVYTLTAGPNIRSVDVNGRALPANTLTLHQTFTKTGPTTGRLLSCSANCPRIVSSEDVHQLGMQVNQEAVAQLTLTVNAQLAQKNEIALGNPTFTVLDGNNNPQVGAKSDTVTVSLPEQVSIEYASNSDAQNIARQLLQDQMQQQFDQNYALVTRLTQFSQPAADPLNNNGMATITIAVGSVAKYQISSAQVVSLKNQIKGMKRENAQAFLARQPGLDAKSLNISLSFGDTLPGNVRQIMITPVDPVNMPSVQMPTVPATAAPSG